MRTKAIIHRITIPGWRPALDNELMREGHWRKSKLKRRDREVVATAAFLAGIPKVAVPPKELDIRKALGIGPLAGDPEPRRRRVAVRVANPHYRGKNVPDPLSPLKSLLDALVQAGLLVDDSDRWCEIVVPVKYVSGEKSTTIFLEDL